MEKKIDRFFLWSIVVVFLFFSSLSIFDSILFTMVFSGMIVLLLHYLIKRMPQSKYITRRKRLRECEKYIEALFYRRTENESVLRKVLPEDTKILYRFPGNTLSKEEVIALWRTEDSSKKEMVIATMGNVPYSTQDFSRSLKKPQVSLMGRQKVVSLLEKSGLQIPTVKDEVTQGSFGRRIRLALQRNRLGVIGSCLYGIVLMTLYWITETLIYLPCALFLVIAGGITWYLKRSTYKK